MNDYLDLKIVVLDNGNDKLIVKVFTNHIQECDPMVCDLYIPTLRDTHPMIAGSGD